MKQTLVLGTVATISLVGGVFIGANVFRLQSNRSALPERVPATADESISQHDPSDGELTQAIAEIER